MHLSSENMAEIISKKDVSISEDSRMALSPINFTNTPYSGKMKAMSSNQKVDQFMKLQSI
jgi:predicted metallo-beta-lactamase superfamily hydrolase